MEKVVVKQACIAIFLRKPHGIMRVRVCFRKCKRDFQIEIQQWEIESLGGQKSDNSVYLMNCKYEEKTAIRHMGMFLQLMQDLFYVLS